MTKLHLIKQAVEAKMANNRQSTANTKTRGEVRGGGRKPWKQKGTGRARVGSSRSPIWVGGGVVFGPRGDRNRKVGLPKKMSRLALEGLILLKTTNKELTQVDSLELDQVKTKTALELIKTLNLEGKALVFITDQIQPELVIATNNLPNVLATTINELSVLDLANNCHVVIEKSALAKFRPNVNQPAVSVTAKTKKTQEKPEPLKDKLKPQEDKL